MRATATATTSASAPKAHGPRLIEPGTPAASFDAPSPWAGADFAWPALRRLLGVGCFAAAGLLAAACANYPMMGGSQPATTVATAPPSLVWGRVTRIEYVPPGTPTSRNANIIGAVVGGVAGAALGHTIGGGSGRDVATVLGGVAGAAVGSQVGRNASGTTTTPSYRVAVQSDQGAVYTFELGAAGELKVGDRVRVENNVIYRQ